MKEIKVLFLEKQRNRKPGKRPKPSENKIRKKVASGEMLNLLKSFNFK
jgi:hypothetical protein